MYGIAFTDNGGPPPGGKIVGWKQNDQGQDLTWDKRADALEACDLSGWTGYVCEYPSGNRPLPGAFEDLDGPSSWKPRP